MSPEVAIFALLPFTRRSILAVVHIHLKHLQEHKKKPRPEAGNTAWILQPLPDAAIETTTTHLPFGCIAKLHLWCHFLHNLIDW